MRNCNVFPELVLQMVMIGEESGRNGLPMTAIASQSEIHAVPSTAIRCERKAFTWHKFGLSIQVEMESHKVQTHPDVKAPRWALGRADQSPKSTNVSETHAIRTMPQSVPRTKHSSPQHSPKPCQSRPSLANFRERLRLRPLPIASWPSTPSTMPSSWRAKDNDAPSRPTATAVQSTLS